MSFNHIPTALWMMLSREEKAILIEVFDIPRTGYTEVFNDEVRKDGYTQEDLSTITELKMVDFVGSTESFPRLWELTVAKARSVVNPPMAVMESVSGGITLADVPNAIVEQQEKLQEYQETDVTVQKISDEPSNNFAPEANFTDKTPKNAKTNKKK